MRIGFTGTREGMNPLQVKAVKNLLKRFNPTICNHGDCIGADHVFHNLSRLHSKASIEIYPPIISTARAFCKGDVIHDKGEYLNRNKRIVDNSDIMIATPKENKEQLRSGTWSTIRYAKKKNKPLFIIYPDDNIEEINLHEII